MEDNSTRVIAQSLSSSEMVGEEFCNLYAEK